MDDRDKEIAALKEEKRKLNQENSLLSNDVEKISQELEDANGQIASF